MYHQQQYYRATKNIAIGDTITPTGAGKNCEEVMLADEIERKASIKAITDQSEYDFKCTKAAGYDIDDLVYIECADQLYKVTASIAQNETMTVGSNIKKWTVDDETSELSSHKVDKTDMAWKFHKNLSTTAAQALPSSFNELLLVGKYGNQRPTLYIPQTMLSANSQFFIWGTDSSTTAAVTVSSSTVTATGVWYQGTAETTNIDVYYR